MPLLINSVRSSVEHFGHMESLQCIADGRSGCLRPFQNMCEYVFATKQRQRWQQRQSNGKLTKCGSMTRQHEPNNEKDGNSGNNVGQREAAEWALRNTMLFTTESGIVKFSENWPHRNSASGSATSSFALTLYFICNHFLPLHTVLLFCLSTYKQCYTFKAPSQSENMTPSRW